MYIDIFLIVLLAWALFSGWRNGFVKEAFNTLGLIFGLALALCIYGLFGEDLAVCGTATNQVLSIVAFLLFCIVVPLVLGFMANALTMAVEVALLGLPNKLLGAGLSAVKFLLLVSFAFNIMSNLCIINSATVDASALYGPVSNVLPFVRDGVGKQVRGHYLTAPADDDARRPDTTYIYYNRHGRSDGLLRIPR